MCVLLQESEGRCVCGSKKERVCVCLLVHPCDAHMRACAFLCPCWSVYSSFSLCSWNVFSFSKASADPKEKRKEKGEKKEERMLRTSRGEAVKITAAAAAAVELEAIVNKKKILGVCRPCMHGSDEFQFGRLASQFITN